MHFGSNSGSPNSQRILNGRAYHTKNATGMHMRMDAFYHGVVKGHLNSIELRSHLNSIASKLF
jgi:hypothetical protein